jgi:hypothetical protein
MRLKMPKIPPTTTKEAAAVLGVPEEEIINARKLLREYLSKAGNLGKKAKNR